MGPRGRYVWHESPEPVRYVERAPEPVSMVVEQVVERAPPVQPRVRTMTKTKFSGYVQFLWNHHEISGRAPRDDVFQHLATIRWDENGKMEGVFDGDITHPRYLLTGTIHNNH